MKPTVFIHTNEQQLIGAKVSAYSLKQASATPDEFDVQVLELKNFPHLSGREGQTFLRDGETITFHNAELQSFTLLRFLPPQVMNFKGRAVVIDPDIFAVGDVNELLTRDMEGKAIMCRRAKNGRSYGSSSMLLDCDKLRHWKWDQQITDLFAHQRDYQKWILLELDSPENIGIFEDEWNHFDVFNEKTKLLHTTKRTTQPWKAGLPFQDLHQAVKEEKKDKSKGFFKSLLGGKEEKKKHPMHLEHPDRRQHNLFFAYLKECLEQGIVSQELLKSQIEQEFIRPDVAAILQSIESEKVFAEVKGAN